MSGKTPVGPPRDSGGLALSGVTYRYPRARAPVISGLSWRVPAGRTVLLGPNGAGKSTLLALAATALHPGHGSVSLDAEVPVSHRQLARFRQRVGWAPQRAQPFPGLTVLEQVAYAAWLKGYSQERAFQAARVALATCGLTPLAGDRAERLSGGQLHRLGLAQVFAHNPEFVLLDEPAAGLDPAQRGALREVFLAESGWRSLVVSTHQVDDLDVVFDRVVVLIEGAILFDDTVPAFLALAAPGVRAPAESAYERVLMGHVR